MCRNFIFLKLCIAIAILSLGEKSLAKDSYSIYAKQSYPDRVYWGDTHVHTSFSEDANFMGNKTLTPVDAYRIAQGETVTAHNGMQFRLHRPLDFLVVADHAEYMGVMAGLRTLDPALLKTEVGKRLVKIFNKSKGKFNRLAYGEIYSSADPEVSEFASVLHEKNSIYSNFVWKNVTANADKYNKPGEFTAFIGYEWTSLEYKPALLEGGLPTYANLHRVVIFRDGSDKVSQILPYSATDGKNPEDLWRFFDEYQKKTRGDVLAIPHNSNLSYGKMFALVDSKGKPLTPSYAKTRSRWEPLIEITQIKGDSETHPILSPADEFSNYETWNSWYGKTTKNISADGQVERKESEYARSALKLGLNYQAKLNANPFKFGFIGSTDAHNSIATTGENNFFGKFSIDAPNLNRMFKPMLPKVFPDLLSWESAASGYAAIWAEKNTRESLFAAMKRKEVYATTGPRMTVRFFGGWEYSVDDAFRPDIAKTGYGKGVPMGGDLTNAPTGKSPNFLIRAVKDPDGANLDRVQVIKGWRDKKGELQEKVYDVALSDNRKENSLGKVKAVGNTVDVKDARYTNSIGDPELAVVWQDPDFDKDELAFYYVRVLEIPTPRWTAYDAKFFGIKDIPEEVPMVTQERAYTSPIWYSPSEFSADNQ